MATEWTVTTAAERIKLDSQRKASTQFTVTNAGSRPDRVVFDIEPGDNAQEDWFHVDSPQRLVRGGDSVSYMVGTTVPMDAPAGTYWFQARVYSVDVPPEENSHLSGRVTFDIAAVKPKPKIPWIPIAAAAAVLLVVFIGFCVILA
jgi:hypothetical protein